MIKIIAIIACLWASSSVKAEIEGPIEQQLKTCLTNYITTHERMLEELFAEEGISVKGLLDQSTAQETISEIAELLSSLDGRILTHEEPLVSKSHAWNTRARLLVGSLIYYLYTNDLRYFRNATLYLDSTNFKDAYSILESMEQVDSSLVSLAYERILLKKSRVRISLFHNRFSAVSLYDDSIILYGMIE